MDKLKKWLHNDSLESKELGLAIMRIGIGLIFMKFGFDKLTGGAKLWYSLGTMTRYVGITFWPTFWGLLAGCAEFFGGLGLVVGLCTRLASLAISFVMIVAVAMHIGVGDPFMKTAFPLSLLMVFIGLMVAGGGSHAIDRRWNTSSRS